MKFCRAFFVLFTLLLASQVSLAGLLIEPQLGYIATGSASGSYTVNGGTVTANDSFSGAQYGARLGYQNLGFMAGLSYQLASLSRNCKNCSPAVKVSYSRDDLGLFVGYSAPLFLRAWLAYNISSKSKTTQTTTATTSGEYLKGSSTEIGVGYSPLPVLSLNLIYRMYNYNKFVSAAGTNYTVAGYKPNEVEVAISAPITFL